jgi:hypothetical protein
MMTEGEVIEKVKKLLALSRSPNEHEAKLAAERAHELMLRHNLSLQKLERKGPEGIEDGTIRKQWRDTEDKFLFPILIEHFFVRIVLDRIQATESRPSELVVHMVGTKSNVEVAQYVYEFLKTTFRALGKDYNARTQAGERARQSYYAGLEAGIQKQLRARKQAVQQEMGLMVVENPNIQRYLDHVFGQLRRSNSTVPLRDHRAQRQGYLDGQKVSINPGVGASDAGQARLAR